MKKLFVVPLVAILALMLCSSGVAYAQEAETTLPDAGTSPDSPFYFMDQWGKSISLAFTFNAQKKAEKALRYADERMAEINAMMTQNKIKQATKAANGYQNYLEVTNKYMEQVRLKGGDVSEKVALMAEKHLGYLSDSTDNVTGDARMLMTQTRERAMICQEMALKNMAQGDSEKAARFNLQLMERQLNRIRVQAEEAKGEAIQARLEIYNRLGNLGANISQIAKGLGEDTTVDQLVGMATAHHLEVLAEAQQRVQGEAQEAIEATIQNCIKNHERIVTRLQAQNRLGQVPEKAPMPNAFQNRVGQSTQAQASQGTQSTGTANGTSQQTGQGGPSGGSQQRGH